MNESFEKDSQWQFLSPWWRFETDPNTESLIWTLKDFGNNSLHLSYTKGLFQISAPKEWALIQEAFTVQIEMHMWAKTFGASLSDPRHAAIQVEVDANDEDKGFQLESLVSSITQNIVITTLFYEINQRLRNA